MEHTTLKGIYVPLVTPFAADGSVALDALEKLAASLLDDGAAGLVALGTTGEPATLSADERRAVTEVCAAVCAERGGRLVVGAGGPGTRAAAEELAGLRERVPGVAAALVTVPSFVRPGEAGTVAHFRALAEASPVPLIVYHIPYRTGQPLSAAAMLELAAVPGVAGVKYATGGLDQDAVELLAARPEGFAVLTGEDVFLAPMLALGAAGGILASAHLATARFVELADAWEAGDAVRARALGHRLAALAAAAFAAPNPAVVKGVLHAQGRIPTPDVRLPLLPAGPAEVAAALELASGLDR
ncbi:dihydrodipicolinate synthase family protein [Streptomyces sp. CB01881]|uniref:dihydrodipicolinate synthase family protein n=1 Tax=Streptomyces sp. CB01881 TaxID=2078691 RepID=UPI000CDC30AE|nr:dihydrodipicolinate synthase family protein [Streptomyces sp. CB01881]AUY52154.1 4-hydroxy-tetrahydrodipicolinate synthase [Streptomyces sp. CB01881]TYC71581.1 4-hydroxy-tetrahydrodipicolinate synthase [Streptomyces sp. CB01881]